MTIGHFITVLHNKGLMLKTSIAVFSQWYILTNPICEGKGGGEEGEAYKIKLTWPKEFKSKLMTLGNL